MMRSLRFRLAAGALIAIALALLATGSILGGVFTDYVVDRYRADMNAIIDQLTAEVEVRDGRLVLDREPADPRFRLPASGRYWQVVPARGDPLRSASLWDTVLAPDRAGGVHGFAAADGPDGKPVLVVERALVLQVGEGGALPLRMMAAFPEEELASALGGYHSTLRLMLLSTAAVLMSAAYLQGAIGLRPLTRLRHDVARVRAGTASLIEDDGPSELSLLVSELNSLLRERENAVERARARASDLAHGLKTPLTVLLQLADHLPEAERALARQQVELVRQRADRQLQAARLGVEQMVSTHLASLCGKLVMVLSPVTRGKGIEWRLDVPGDLAVQADAADVAECLGNVLDNATRYAHAAIEISAGPAVAGRIAIRISDDGPGIAPADAARLLERGEIGSLPPGEGSGGSGLGLAISRDIARAYGGDLTLGEARLGGLAVTIDFPAAAGI
ncbi:sensor histidine kinase [Gellertiella hungarica]|uniref:histidine kinase n=1 Tax=Gellertiella hungarica TaxID=1572859 RepID=A0A7W6J7U0_9HYPH|nr:HAMP domain-containing sensor histidine kinase [Gellertiella hungarica]MBB4066409.1 signal transduction histidine kinase [Gellertiella hungarica]